jgi:hypothetical protein
MRTGVALYLALSSLLVSVQSQAGPNIGGVLVLHDAGLAYTGDTHNYCGLGSNPSTCEGVDARIDGTSRQVWKVLAAFAPNVQPRLKGVGFAVQYDDSSIILDDWGPCPGSSQGFEMPGSGWPAPGRSMMVVFPQTQLERLVEVYWFAGHNAQGTPAQFAVQPSAWCGQTGFADDSVPAQIDEFAACGVLGFNRDGYVPCTNTSSAEGRGADVRRSSVLDLTAHPMPAQITTRISWRLCRPAETRLRIVDSSGRAVWTRELGWRGAEPTAISWDGFDTRGRRVPTGVYFAQVLAGDERASVRILWLR